MKDADGRKIGEDNWLVIQQALPEGWQEQARACGALRRTRGVVDAPTLLRILLLHLAQGCSLAETAVRARRAGLASLSAVAIFKRLRAGENWLLWMAQRLRGEQAPLPETAGRVVRVVDATTISEPGSTGSDWRLHYSLRLSDLRCDFFQLTDRYGGESWKRIPVQPGDILIGDRLYGRPSGVAHVRRAGGDVMVRVSPALMPLEDEQGERLDPLRAVRGLRVGRLRSWNCQVRHEGEGFAGRLIALRRSAAATRRAQRRLRRDASREGRKVSPRSWRATSYLFLWTSLPASFAPETALEYYRRRWQIELAFKRMKSLAGLGHLPKKDPASARAWLYGKLLVSLLAERLDEAARTLSPWGYVLPPTKPVA